MEEMDKKYTWTSVLVPDPNQPKSPRLILRRVLASISQSGSSPGSESGFDSESDSSSESGFDSESDSGHSEASSSLGNTTEQRYTWICETVPNPDDDGIPRLILRRVPIPLTPRGYDPEPSVTTPPVALAASPLTTPEAPPESLPWWSSPVQFPTSPCDFAPEPSCSAPPQQPAGVVKASLPKTPEAPAKTRPWWSSPGLVPKTLHGVAPEQSSSTPPHQPSGVVEASLPETPEAPAKARPLVSSPDLTWVKRAKGLLKLRHRVGSQWGKRAAKPTDESAGKRFCLST